MWCKSCFRKWLIFALGSTQIIDKWFWNYLSSKKFQEIINKFGMGTKLIFFKVGFQDANYSKIKKIAKITTKIFEEFFCRRRHPTHHILQPNTQECMESQWSRLARCDQRVYNWCCYWRRIKMHRFVKGLFVILDLRWKLTVGLIYITCLLPLNI